MNVKYIGPYPTARVTKFKLNHLKIGDIREVSEEAAKELIALGNFVSTSEKPKSTNDLELKLAGMSMLELREFAKENNLRSKDNDKESLRTELLAEIKGNGGL